MTAWRWLLFHALRLVDQLAPGWCRPSEPRAEHLSQESFVFWMTRHGRGGQP